ncbi:MAG TPA: BNR-4 repeat-containing protein, partial [Phycisphaerae bacterium]
MPRPHLLQCLAAALLPLLAACQFQPSSPSSRPFFTVKPNGGFNWFLDNRALLDGDKIIVGSIAGTTARGSNYGDVQITAYDLSTNTRTTATLAPAFAPPFTADDHMAPVLLKRSDGRYLAAFTKHDLDNLMRWSLSTRPNDASAWDPLKTVSGNSLDDHGMCFSNLIQLPAPPISPNAAATAAPRPGRIFNFTRGPGDDPNYMLSDDNGLTFKYGGHILLWDNPDPKNPGRPYIKYAAANTNQIWMACTQDHPNELPTGTGIYASFIRNNAIFTSNATRIGPLSTTTDATIKPTQLTEVFKGAPDAVAYLDDLKIGPDNQPVLTFSVRKDDGHDLRYYFARFDGRDWHSREIAHAGTTIYMGESNYAGLAAIDNFDPYTLFISANSDPVIGTALKSTADGKRHFEIFQGTSTDQGQTFTWQPLTSNSPVDNIRPLVPLRSSPRRILLWLRGTMTTYKNFDLDIVGILDPTAPKMPLPLHMQAKISASPKTDSTLASGDRSVDARAAQ